ncbi:MAG: hypothetical protein RLZ12_722 [Bacillota bacterium]
MKRFKLSVLYNVVTITLFWFIWQLNLQPVKAAAPITHIVVAYQLAPELGVEGEEEKKLFLLGTSLPDIRYLRQVKREDTHPEHVTWQMVLDEKNPVKKGMLLHALLDKKRDAYLLEKEWYTSLPDRHRVNTVKLAEDCLLYNCITMDEWRKIQTAFDEKALQQQVLQQAQLPNLDEEQLTRWCALLYRYIDGLPQEDQSIFNFAVNGMQMLLTQEPLKLNPSQTMQTVISERVESLLKLSQETVFKDYMTEFYSIGNLIRELSR